MTPSTVTTLAQRELSDALRNRWFVAYSIAFVALSVALAMLVINSAGYGGVSGFGRTSAALINLVLVLAPLMGLTLGAQALSSEREQGTMSYLLAQPVSPFEMFIAKFIGLAIAIGAAIVAGFALATLTMSFMGSGGSAGAFLPLTGLTVLLAWASLAIGYLISSFSRRTMSALGVADRVLMLENAVYSVITVEGCAAILWKDGKSPEMREKAATDWTDWESSIVSLDPDYSPGPRMADPAWRMAFARLCALRGLPCQLLRRRARPTSRCDSPGTRLARRTSAATSSWRTRASRCWRRATLWSCRCTTSISPRCLA